MATAEKGTTPDRSPEGGPHLSYSLHPHDALVDRLSRRSDLLWGAIILWGVVLTTIATQFFPYPQSHSGVFWIYLGSTVHMATLFIFAGRFRAQEGALIRKLALFGLAAGVLEIFPDYLLVEWLPRGRLVYLSQDARLLSSPVYVPLIWACIICNIGYPVNRLYGLWRRRVGRRALYLASLFAGLSAAILLGPYETVASWAGWWQYEPARVMLGPCTVVYIPLSECLIFATLLPLFRFAVREEHSEVYHILLSAIAFTAVTFVGYAVAFLLVG